ncbi:GLTP domain-containing protein [Aphelenchoides bicaudatus]|nr:GLTP domain-containing protein [Aphelenchoides bicaudatus]
MRHKLCFRFSIVVFLFVIDKRCLPTHKWRNQVNQKLTFLTLNGYFPDVVDGDKIPTGQFLNACQGIGEFVGFLGTAFLPVKNDVLGNVKKVRTKFDSNPEAFPFLQDLVETDLREHNGSLGMASEGLLWLKRGLEFMLELLLGMVKMHREHDQSDSLHGLLSECYERTLKHHHGFISRQLFKVVLVAAPSRQSLIKTVAYGKDGYEEYCIQHMEAHLANFKHCVHSIVNFYHAKDLDRCYFSS